ncbi:MAG: YccT family protein [Aeromonas sp.]
MQFKQITTAIVGLCLSSAAMAQSQINVTTPYNALLLDGQSVNVKLLEQRDALPLTSGPHQLVVEFEGNYSTRNDNVLITAEPLVINFTVADNQTLRLDYALPRNAREARHFATTQSVRLADAASGQAVASEQFMLPKVEGFQLARDYQAELIKLGKAFNQPAVSAAAGTTALAPAPQTASPAALKQLQHWYNQADNQTRKAFQIWLIEQQ